MPQQLSAKSGIRLQFFELLFGDNEGLICLATTNSSAPRVTFKQTFFKWPEESARVESYVLRNESQLNVYFCVNLLAKPHRVKENCLATDFLWSDLDNVNPDIPDIKQKIPPGIVVRSSPGKYQAYWRLTSFLPPFQAEDYSRRLAYYTGADKSGWDLGQLMRVPFTTNHKYETKPIIALEYALETRAPSLLFEALPIPSVAGEAEYEAAPLLKDLPSADQIIYKYALHLKGSAFAQTYTEQPTAETDWSKVIWKLIHICLEAGMSAEEVLVVTNSAPCNKYQRDGRPISHLWRDIVKARKSQNNINAITENFIQLAMPQLVSQPASETFIDTYRAWAAAATDAVPEFHDLCCFILLSSLTSGSVRLATSFGTIVPNLWGLILGDSTLTRKTTAMRLVIDFLVSMDKDMIVATDGSVEGLLAALGDRPNKVSMFYKDEISGFFSAINRRDYLSGMPETLTALYDVPAVYSRRLRKETIHIENPAFIMFGGGVKDRVYDNITEEYVISGFLPRFLVVSGDTDTTKLRRMARPSQENLVERSKIYSKFGDIFEQYGADVITRIGGQEMRMAPRIMADLSDGAWTMYGNFEEQLLGVAQEVANSDMALPTFERLSRSLLKMAMILAASRQYPDKDNQIKVDENDIVNAAWYVQNWGRYTVDLILNANKRYTEKILDKILAAILKYPGIPRSDITRHYKLNKREADEILATLEDRMLIRKEQFGRGWKYWAT